MPRPRPARSLLSVRPGETVEIHQILFDSVREHCARAGLVVGDALTGRGFSDRAIAVQTPSGVVAAVDRTVARFVQVETPAERAREAGERDRYA